jgi:hypothetical protein
MAKGFDRSNQEASHLLSGVIPKRRRVHTPANLRWMPVNDGEILPVEGDALPLSSVPLLAALRVMKPSPPRGWFSFLRRLWS